MAQDSAFRPYEAFAGSHAAPVLRTDGVLTRRVFAYLVDFVVLAFLVAVLGLLIGILGLLTFGLTWPLYAVLGPATGILYSALTVGGAGQGTVGMRAFGVAALDATTGGRPSRIGAGLHAVLFYVALGMLPLLIVDVLFGLGRGDRRLGHDLLATLVFVRR